MAYAFDQDCSKELKNIIFVLKGRGFVVKTKVYQNHFPHVFSSTW